MEPDLAFSVLTMESRNGGGIVSNLMNQKGFTLIEFIAVIIILGVNGAVATPKFIGLTEATAERTAEQAVADGRDRLTNQYAIQSMNPDANANNLAGIIGSVNTDAGE